MGKTRRTRDEQRRRRRRRSRARCSAAGGNDGRVRSTRSRVSFADSVGKRGFHYFCVCSILGRMHRELLPPTDATRGVFGARIEHVQRKPSLQPLYPINMSRSSPGSQSSLVRQQKFVKIQPRETRYGKQRAVDPQFQFPWQQRCLSPSNVSVSRPRSHGVVVVGGWNSLHAMFICFLQVTPDLIRNTHLPKPPDSHRLQNTNQREEPQTAHTTTHFSRISLLNRLYSTEK